MKIHHPMKHNSLWIPQYYQIQLLLLLLVIGSNDLEEIVLGVVGVTAVIHKIIYPLRYLGLIARSMEWATVNAHSNQLILIGTCLNNTFLVQPTYSDTLTKASGYIVPAVCTWYTGDSSNNFVVDMIIPLLPDVKRMIVHLTFFNLSQYRF